MLIDTAKGRKRKLSCYKSRNARKGVKKRIVFVESDSSSSSSDESLESEFNENLVPLKIFKASDSDVSVEVKHGESSISEKDYETLSDILSDSEPENIEERDCTESENTDSTSKSFKQKCVDELKSDEIVLNIVEKLEQCNKLHDFMKLMRHLKNGTIAMDNIVFLLMLERAKFQSCKNTVAMRYSKVTKLFWSIVYRLCKSSGLKFFSGEKNWGQVVACDTSRSRYDPDKSKINFAVPSEKVLRYIDQRLPKVIPPGKIQQSLDLLQDQKDVILMADGKLVTKGLKENFCGDVDLFGHETEPNLKELDNEIQKHLEYISNCTCNFAKCTDSDRYQMLTDLVNVICAVVMKIRKFVANEHKRLDTYQKSVFSEAKYMKVISACKTNIYTSRIWIKKILKVTLQIHDVMAKLQHNTHLFNLSSGVALTCKSNVRLLHNATTVASKVNPMEYSHLIKCGSEIHKDLVRQTLITTGTIGTAIGLNNISSMRSHFQRYIMDVGYVDETTETNYKGISTLANVVMPSMLPSCAVLYEEGCRFLDGKNKKKILCSPKHWIIRHHHTTSEKKWRCNHLLDTDYDNIIVLFLDDKVKGCLADNHCALLEIIATMRVVKCMKLWAISTNENIASVTECVYSGSVWKAIWNEIRGIYDQKIPALPKTTSDIKERLFPILASFGTDNTRSLLQVQLLEESVGRYQIHEKFTPYNIPKTPQRSENTEYKIEDFIDICYEISELIEEGYNYLRVEASEILAFVATNSDRIIQAGIPPHLPVAYGMRGHSLSMKTMRNMVNDIRNELKKRNTSVLCEVYDGQFHQLIVRSENSEPLTKLQMMHDHFKDVMTMYDKSELLEKILPYSEIIEEDRTILRNSNFEDSTVIHLDSVKVELKEVNNKRYLTMETNEIGGISMKDLVTYWRPKLKVKNSSNINVHGTEGKRSGLLTEHEMKELIVGTKLHRRLHIGKTTDDNENDSDSDDSDYYPENEEMVESESENSDQETNIVDESTLTNVSVVSSGQSCIKRILIALKKLDNKHNWKEHNVNSFLETFLKNKSCIEKLFLYEMDVINSEIFASFGKELFQKKDSKSIRIDKICKQLKKLPQLFEYSSSEEEITEYEVLKLLDIVKKFIMNSKYPKDFLAAQFCKITHEECITKWQNRSTVPSKIFLPFLNEYHHIFNYPEKSVQRGQIEMRTFDYSHILNNLRFHICNRGFDNVRTEAFLQVSDMDHDVLPRAVVEMKLDRQNCMLSKRFFSKDVQKILTRCGYHSESKFVKLVRDWYDACDMRGMSVNDRLKKLNAMFKYLSNLMPLDHYPPQRTHVCGIPIRTYEALMQSISTRFTLFQLSSSKSYNARAISTLAVESFFSDLNRFEFSGLGAPKSVDIPKLITHIVHVNTTKHNLNRGFEFTTSTRDNYPCYLLSSNVPAAGQMDFQPHTFDVKKKRQ